MKYYSYILNGLLLIFILVTIGIFALDETHIYLISIFLVVQILLVLLAYVIFRRIIERWTLAHNTGVKFLASIYPAIAAVWLIFVREEIYNNTTTWIDLVRSGEIWKDFLLILSGDDGYLYREYCVDSVTVYYLVIVLIWLRVYFFFVTNESAKNEERTRKLEATILRAPNPQIFKENILLNKKVFKYLSVLKNPKPTRNVYDITFQYLLEDICYLTRAFMNKLDGDSEIYGANIMLYIETDKHKNLVEFLRSKDNCLHFRDTEISKIAGLLRLVPGLVSHSTKRDKVEQDNTSFITLPVVRAPNIEKFYEENVPGAPLATFAGEFIINDVLDENNYYHLKSAERSITRSYWKDRAPEVRSVISIRIPFNGAPTGKDFSIVGVLNIDSTRPFPLGNDNEFHPTYWSLVLPLMQQIAPYLEEYHKLYLSDLQAFVNGDSTITNI